MLDAYVTTFAYSPKGLLGRTFACIPGSIGQKLRRDFERRSLTSLPSDLVKTFPLWEVARTAAAKSGCSPIFVDRIWDRLCFNFDALVAGRFVPGTAAVYAYEYTAKATFERARAEGVAAILDLPSLNSRAFEDLQRAEKQRFPELRSKYDSYFEAQFERRQRRRDDEIQLADVIVANSQLTMRSHVQGGAKPENVIVVPLASPQPISAVAEHRDRNSPLNVVWAGNFSLGKGAHYFLEACRQLGSARFVRTAVYGAVNLPESALRPLPEGFTFYGTVPQPDLFAAFQTADLLMFPTLSDGFGMVVSEAFSRGLPVITTDRAGAAELVRHGENGLIVPAADAAALGDALQWCLDNREKLHAMRLAALNTAKRWGWPDYRRTLVASIDQALSKKGFSTSVSRSDPRPSSVRPKAAAS